MSAKTIKRDAGHSAWAHKNGTKASAAVVEMHKIARTANGRVVTPNGSLPGAAYELTRLAHPNLALPRFDELPLC